MLLIYPYNPWYLEDLSAVFDKYWFMHFWKLIHEDHNCFYYISWCVIIWHCIIKCYLFIYVKILQNCFSNHSLHYWCTPSWMQCSWKILVLSQCALKLCVAKKALLVHLRVLNTMLFSINTAQATNRWILWRWIRSKASCVSLMYIVLTLKACNLWNVVHKHQ